MTSLYGTFQYFDYDSFLKEQCSCEKVTQFEYPEGTLMYFLKKNHPGIAQIVIKAKYDQKFADSQGRFTFFIDPVWDKIKPAELDGLNVYQCRIIVDSNTLKGRIRYEDIMTSKDSQVFSIDKGVPIHLWWDFGTSTLKKDNLTIIAQHTCSNGILFLLQP